MNDMVPYSRTGVTHPLGKMTAVLKLRYHDITEERLLRMAHEAGMTVSELAREVLIKFTTTDAEYQELQARRGNAVSALWDKRGS